MLAIKLIKYLIKFIIIIIKLYKKNQIKIFIIYIIYNLRI